jgi:hypothetical protein
VNGDVILVDQGTYVENINYHGKWITVKSVYGPDSTIIEGMPGTTVSFVEGEDLQSIFNGFTVRHFKGELGEGIKCIDSSAVIKNNIIQMNRIWAMQEDGMGAGVYLENSNAIIDNNVIEENTIDVYDSTAKCCGAGICCTGTGSPTIVNNTIRYNRLWNDPDGSGGRGAGICFKDHTAPLIMNNLIEGNINDLLVYYIGNLAVGGGISCEGDGEAYIVNNIICHNEVSLTLS